MNPEDRSGGAMTIDELSDVMRDYLNVTHRLQSTHEMLQTEVQRLRRELASKDRELERRRRLASLGELAAGVAHEVRNPLGAIQLFSGLLKSECRDLHPALQLIEKIEAGIRAIDGVVKDTLALAPRGCQPQFCRLAPIVAGAADLSQRVLITRGVQLSTQLADPRSGAFVDEPALQRVLVNLIINAAEASPSGQTVELHVEPERDGMVIIRVADRGCGFTPEAQEKLFDPFFTTKSHGAGLGLAIAHRLMEALGGRIEARNRPGGGAEFLLTLVSDAGAFRGVASDNEASNAA